MPNFAFIDGQNLNLGIRDLGWNLDWKRFHVHLQEHYHVGRAYYFIGYIPDYQGLYTGLQKAGFTLVFKDVTYRGDGKPKGNVDAELVLQAMIELPNYNRAVIVTAMATSPASSGISTSRKSSSECSAQIEKAAPHS